MTRRRLEFGGDADTDSGGLLGRRVAKRVSYRADVTAVVSRGLQKLKFDSSRAADIKLNNGLYGG